MSENHALHTQWCVWLQLMVKRSHNKREKPSFKWSRTIWVRDRLWPEASNSLNGSLHFLLNIRLPCILLQLIFYYLWTKYYSPWSHPRPASRTALNLTLENRRPHCQLDITSTGSQARMMRCHQMSPTMMRRRQRWSYRWKRRGKLETSVNITRSKGLITPIFHYERLLTATSHKDTQQEKACQWSARWALAYICLILIWLAYAGSACWQSNNFGLHRQMMDTMILMTMFPLSSPSSILHLLLLQLLSLHPPSHLLTWHTSMAPLAL